MSCLFNSLQCFIDMVFRQAKYPKNEHKQTTEKLKFKEVKLSELLKLTENMVMQKQEQSSSI